MTTTTEFGNVSRTTAQQKFHTEFAKLLEKYQHTKIQNQDELPSKVHDRHLFHLFEAAYPIHTDYLDVLFEDSKSIALTHGLTHPPIPDHSIFTTDKEVMPGMGRSFFKKLVYLQNLAETAHIEMTKSIPAIAVPKVLPSLQLLAAQDIFHALRIEASKAMLPKHKDDEDTPKKSLLPAWIRKSKSDTGAVLESGFVMKLETSALVSGGTRTVASVSLGDADKLVEIALDGAQRDHIKVGDLIGVTGLKSVKGLKDIKAVDHVSILVPVSISSYLKNAEPDFRPTRTDALNDAHSGTLIYGRVIEWDDRTHTALIKDKDGKLATLKLSEPARHYKFQENMALLSSPVQLGHDGIYTIAPKNTLKLEAPHSGRILSGLRYRVPQQSFEGDSFQPTEPLMN